jgi:hypothetical protein
MMKKGILLQGPITEWTADIVNEYKENFEDTTIFLSTWTNQNIDNITCDYIQIELPKPTYPHNSTINYQILGARKGINKIDADVILKTKTNQFIHNNEIFNIFEKNCPKHKIMTDNLISWKNKEYRISDFCQVATKKVLEDYWNNMPYYDGSYAIPPEVYLTKNYVVNFKKDNRLWNEIIDEYFCLKDYYKDFKMEFEKFVGNESKQAWFRKKMSVDEVI